MALPQAPRAEQKIQSLDLTHYSISGSRLEAERSPVEKLFQDLRQAFRDRDGEALRKLFTDDAQSYSPGSEAGALITQGGSAIVDFFVDKIFPRFPAVDFILGEVVEGSGNRHSVQWKSVLTVDNGVEYQNDGAWFITVRDGKISFLYEYFDSEYSRLNMTQGGEGQFYDFISPLYSRIYGASWEAIVERQGRKLEEIISSHASPDRALPCEVLDSACGIGTQILGLAKNPAYRVTGSDLSEGALQQARDYVAKLDLPVTLIHGNMLELAKLVSGKKFDVVLSCDNVLRHLPDREQVGFALQELHNCLQPGGIVIATLRDFSPERQQILAGGTGHSIKPYSAHNSDGTLEAYFQVGRFEGDFYHFDFFAVAKQGQVATARTASLKLLAVDVDEVVELMRQSGFSTVDVYRSVPEFYGHDVLVAKK
jgi:SAM-dependent methyltransferase